MKKKRNDLRTIPEEMQATLDKEKERQTQSRIERFGKNLEIVKKKMEAEFVQPKSNDEFATPKSDGEFVKEGSKDGDALINPAQEGNDGEIISQDV